MSGGGRTSLGANWREGRTTFEVWAAGAANVDLAIEENGATPHERRPVSPRREGARAGEAGTGERIVPMQPAKDGYFTVTLNDAPPGTRYRYRVDGRGPFPDPASRFQPAGVHGPSQVEDPTTFRWTDAGWRGGATLADTVLYELHVGAFTPAGTFRAAIKRLPVLRDLGVTAIELMPVADFAGDRNWGYDGVALFAPARCYGAPDDLRALVDAAHMLNIAVHLDVVYNHLGPDGAYHGAISPHYLARAHQSKWGDAFNLDGPQSGPVRDFIVENARRWILEYHIDGLRLDATHAIVDASPRPIVAELTAAVHDAAAAVGRTALVIAEDARNLRRVLDAETKGGINWGVDAVWSDDFHHQMRRVLAGDSDGYFADFTGSAADVATTIDVGWLFRGEVSGYFGGLRGSDPAGIARDRFVFFIQNHDQVGNRAMGDRLHHAIDLAAWRAASALLLMLPETPLLFMGQEWAASTPFRFFTDHHAVLGKAVTAGRHEEFRMFASFADPALRAAIPDPQDPATFETSRLDWEEREREPHRSMLRLTRRLLKLRRTEAALRSAGRSGDATAHAVSPEVVVLRREARDAAGRHLLVVVRLRGEGEVDLRGHATAVLEPGMRWTALLTTEQASFVAEPKALALDRKGPHIRFARPGAVVFVARPSRPRATPESVRARTRAREG